jgi:hypothetical protein
MAACSACAGDYEDPERTAWRGASEGEQDDDDPNSEAPSDRLGASREIGATRVESEDEFLRSERHGQGRRRSGCGERGGFGRN